MRGSKLNEIAAIIRAHPRFPEAARRFTTEYLAWRSRIGLLNKVLSNLGRERLLEHVLFLHYVREEGDAGATFERLAALSAARDGVGARAARTALRLSQIAGMITVTRSPSDKRLRIFTPTETLLTTTRDAYALAFRVIDEIAPGRDFSGRLLTDRAFLNLVLERTSRAYLSAPPRGERVLDALYPLLRLEGGRSILATAVDRHWRGLDLPTAQDISKQFYVSASQTRLILKAAETQGLIVTAGRGRLVSAEPLAQAYLDTLARYVASFSRRVLDLDESAFR